MNRYLCWPSWSLSLFSEGWTTRELATFGVEGIWLARSNHRLGFIVQMSASSVNTPSVEAAAG